MKVAIVEDHALFADFVRVLCERELGYEVVFNVTLGAGVVERLLVERPQLLILDLSLPDMDGLDIARAMRKDLPELRILVLSSLRDPVSLYRVQEAGVHGFVDKRHQNLAVLREALPLVAGGEPYFAPVFGQMTHSIQQDPKAYYRILSVYDQVALSMMGEARSDAEIAAALRVSESTMQSRRRDIMRKLNIHSTPKLMRFAIEHGFTRPEHFPPKKEAGPVRAAAIRGDGATGS